MKRRNLILTAATLGLGALVATATLAHGPGSGDQGNMQGYGNHMGQGSHMGQGNMGQGYGMGAGFNADCQTNQALDKPLTVDDVRANLGQRIEQRGNDRIKVGKVAAKDDKTIVAEIVTIDDSLIRRIEIDKATGRHNPVN